MFFAALGQILIHLFCNLLGVLHRLHNGAGTQNHIAAGKNAIAGGMAVLVGGKQAVAAHFQAGRGADDAVLCALADGDDHARAGEKLLLTGRGNVAVLVHLHFLVVDAVVGNAGRAHAVVKLYAVGLGVVHLAHAGGRLVTAAEHADMAHALAQGGAGHVHGRVARADDDEVVAQVIHIGVDKVVNSIVDMAQAFTGDAHSLGLPYAGADEDRLVAVALQVVHRQGAANGRVGADFNAQLDQLLLVAVQNALGQAELRDAVAQHAADLLAAFKNGHIVTAAGQQYADGDARRAAADDGHALALFRLHLRLQMVQIGVRDIVFDAGKMHRRAFAAQHAVTFTLLLVVAHQRADDAQRVVLVQHFAGFFLVAGAEQLDRFRDIGADGAAFAAHRLFAVQAAAGFVYNMDRHFFKLLFFSSH